MVFISSLNKNIFPLYINPKEDELFSSWFCRLSINHKIKPQSFILNYLNSYPILSRDIDFLAPPDLIAFIEQHTPLSVKSVESMFLKSYDSIICENGSSELFYNNILNVGIHHRKRKRFGLMFCHRCLQNEVYYKKTWRFQSSIVCLKCNCYLQDKCPRCKSPIMFHRINISDNISVMDFKPLFICSECECDLREVNEDITPHDIDVEYQQYVDDTIKNGYNDSSMYSFSYIKSLLVLAMRVRSSGKSGRFRQAVISYFPDFKRFDVVRDDIRYWNVEDRRNTLPFIYSILRDKEILKEILKQGKVTKSYIDPENTLPYWIIKHTLF